MTTKSEIKGVDFYKDRNRANNIVLYLYTSNYMLIKIYVCKINLFENFGNIVSSIGFSGRHTGISAI